MAQTKSWLKMQVQVQVERRRQIGILGGNFNPIHNGHLLIADQAAQILGLEMVYLMPEYLPPHVDSKETISPQHRLAMIGLAIKDNSNLGIEMMELSRKGKSYTYDTMQQLTQKNPDTDYYFIIGGDMVKYLPKWSKIDELFEIVRFVGVERIGFSAETPYPVIWIDVPKVEISSTRIRKMIAMGNSPNYLMPKVVYRYIEEKGLYLDE